ncbi:NAD(P)/FAD-dependent oxidoreductase [Clostridium fermenticellae]|uniref:NAD(P)/FAD-dependent oxidoreductase n=1 Tax=Clostridium fermenticellae TaxID=2068654 RepID=A0A386H493_9CLOT|nr:NAD(P)/FAD-dependent oxidoreductase [Clostridium fermenticellae]AYD40305.1 NAD(P)/FAD-dependent oxidoreductase [Clostridium fermenticellae]
MLTTVVIGGGPAGMMAAINASQKYKTILIEKNEKLGKKLYITGKGRCNITNSKDISEFFNYIPGNPNFLYSALYTFTNENTIDFFEKLGVKFKIERGDRVFPLSDKSSDIISALQKSLKQNNVDIMLNTSVSKFICNKNRIIGVELKNGEILKADFFILCTGGMSYPQTGSSGDGYKFAKDLGHTITDITPALVPIEINEEWVKNLQGLSLKNIELKILKNNRVICEDFGEMLFTHFGISGPIVLSMSREVGKQKKLRAVIDLKPAISRNELDKRIQKDFKKYINKDFKNSLDDLLPRKLIDTVIMLSKIDPNKKVNLIKKEERIDLVDLLKGLPLTIKGCRPIDEAIVTSGGINTKEIDPSTMRSKIIDNLYFAGEIIDVDAFTGGFNIQIALSTGYLAGISLIEL